MTTLKALRNRRKSVQSTKKITMAMKMVAGAKLRRAQERVESGRTYANLMDQIIRGLADQVQALETPQPLLTGTGKSDVHLMIVATSDRGLCGPFNSSILRQARRMITLSQSQGQTVKLLSIGRKGKDVLSREYGTLLVESYTEIGHHHLRFSDALQISDRVLKMFEDGIFDICTLIYNHFRSPINQEVTTQQLIPISKTTSSPSLSETSPLALYEYEPSERKILSEILPQNVAVQIYNGLLENAASEQGARMTAMDNASRNADDIIQKLTLEYNRTRQSQITRELIEIISGAEAL